MCSGFLDAHRNSCDALCVLLSTCNNAPVGLVIALLSNCRVPQLHVYTNLEPTASLDPVATVHVCLAGCILKSIQNLPEKPDSVFMIVVVRDKQVLARVCKCLHVASLACFHKGCQPL